MAAQTRGGDAARAARTSSSPTQPAWDRWAECVALMRAEGLLWPIFMRVGCKKYIFELILYRTVERFIYECVLPLCDFIWDYRVFIMSVYLCATKHWRFHFFAYHTYIFLELVGQYCDSILAVKRVVGCDKTKQCQTTFWRHGRSACKRRREHKWRHSFAHVPRVALG